MAKVKWAKKPGADRWFLVWRHKMWTVVKVPKVPSFAHRKYNFIRPTDPAHRFAFYDLRIAHRIPLADIQKKFTLRVLHDFKWWEYPPGNWKFRGVWM